MADKLPITIGMILLLSLAGAGYYIADMDNTYYCESKELVAGCFKLSTPDAETHTRCYYNETSPKKYVYCKEGWNNIKDYPDLVANLTAEVVDLENISEEEEIEIVNKTDITLINETKVSGDYEYWIVGVESYPDMDSKERIFKCEYKEKVGI